MNTKVDRLGECKFTSPAHYNQYLSQSAVVAYRATFNDPQEMKEFFQNAREDNADEPLYFEQAGPYEKLFFEPKNVTAGIVTCGGLCPGINDVIRSIVMELHYRYGAKRIYGFRYGFAGMVREVVKNKGYTPYTLDPGKVTTINHTGGSFLASSRGNQDPSKIVDYLMDLHVNILFCIGGDGTLRGAKAIYDEIQRRAAPISVIGIPKTIDNDINMIQKTFGFATAVSKAIDAISAAHVESTGAPNGVGLVKLMGRHSGFIAAHAALASKDVNFVLIPEQDFDLEGKGAFLESLKERVTKRGHAVVIVAEGAGQKFVEQAGTDPSGNKKLGDIGIFLKKKITEYFAREKAELTLKYIDPSYIIRSVETTADDSVFCGYLAQNAVHAAMAGKTGMVVGMWNNYFTNLPIDVAVAKRKVVSDDTWRAVLAVTGQPDSMLARDA